jgi:hypothetical protein
MTWAVEDRVKLFIFKTGKTILGNRSPQIMIICSTVYDKLSNMYISDDAESSKLTLHHRPCGVKKGLVRDLCIVTGGN